jgi:hypothetical protein
MGIESEASRRSGAAPVHQVLPAPANRLPATCGRAFVMDQDRSCLKNPASLKVDARDHVGLEARLGRAARATKGAAAIQVRIRVAVRQLGICG